MKQSTVNRIRVIYDLVEATEPDISTERLLQTIADIAGIDVDVVVSALIRSGSYKEAK